MTFYPRQSARRLCGIALLLVLAQVAGAQTSWMRGPALRADAGISSRQARTARPRPKGQKAVATGRSATKTAASLQELQKPDRKAGGRSLEKSLQRITQWLQKQMGVALHATDIELHLERPWGSIAGRSAQAQALEDYLPLLKHELSKYPAGLPRKGGLHSIVLCSGLAMNGEPRPGLPDFQSGTLFLDVEGYGDRTGYYARVLHHEIFHLFDFHDDGVIYRDSEWEALNKESFRYGAAQDSRRAMDVYAPSNRRLGFLDEYASFGVQEDKAEVFAFLFTERRHLRRRTHHDPWVAKKVSLMMRHLKDICPAMSEGYWRELDAACNAGRRVHRKD